MPKKTTEELQAENDANQKARILDYVGKWIDHVHAKAPRLADGDGMELKITGGQDGYDSDGEVEQFSFRFDVSESTFL